MKTLVVALIAAGLLVPAFARMEVDQPKAEKKKKNEKKKNEKKAEKPKAR
jgi:hypothetical protein